VKPSAREPVRSCLACRRKGSKAQFIRVVSRPDGCLEIDDEQKAPGRGAYMCPQQGCLKTAVKKKAFARALRLGGAHPGLSSLYEALGARVTQASEESVGKSLSGA
jgi:predicted RNA-binding protein YlxR (DUF448 family)